MKQLSKLILITLQLSWPILLTALLAIAVSSCRPAPASSPHPLPAGHVEIRVEFNDIPVDAFNKLSGLLTKLAEENSAMIEGSGSLRDVGDGHSFHGWTNDGFVIQQYKPDHPVPSAEVEKAMQERLTTFLKDHKIDPGDAKLQLRYGK